MNPLTRLWRRIFPRPYVAPELAVPAAVASSPAGRALWQKLIDVLGPAPEAARVEYKIPTKLPGVLPKKESIANQPSGVPVTMAMDGGNNEMPCMAFDDSPVAWGFAGNGSGVIGPGLAFLGFPYLAELNQISEYRIPAESLSTEMTRRWMKLKNKGKDDLEKKLHEITERMEQLKLRERFRQSGLKTEEFGRSHLYVSIKGQDDDTNRQLPLGKIDKGALLGFSVVEPYWCTPYSWNATHPERSDFYKPQSWYVIGRKTHATRLLTFVFREVPDLLKPAYDFSGISMTQLMMPYINRWLRSAKNVNDLINIFSIVTLSTDVQSLLQDSAEFINRMTAFTKTRDNRGLMVVNKNTEELGMSNVPLGSLDKLQAQAQEHMATPARMPLLKMFGIVPSGLGDPTDGEMQCWYDYVHGLQELGFSPHMERVLELVQMDLYGPDGVDPNVTYEWLSLFEPIGKDKADILKSKADTAKVYYDMGAVGNDEVRTNLQMDPESGWDGLEGDAPEPPAVLEQQLGAQLDAQNNGPPGEK